MKNIFKLLFGSLFITAFLLSCKKDENKIFLEESTAPVLSASSTTAMVLSKADKDKDAIKLDWTNPNYKFTTGISSQDVTYTLQFDTAGKNFTSGNLQERAISKDLSVTLTVKELNGFLSKMELKAGEAYNMEIRIKSALVNGAASLYSNVIKIKITPYLDFAVEPPGLLVNNYNDGNLWVTGDAFASNWSNPLPNPYDISQKFTRIDVLHYELIVSFNATGNYKLIQKQGDWSTQYHALAPSSALSGELEKKDADPAFASPGAGMYKIAVNFQTGKYTLTKQ
jgi:starch-binding outer membrane protein SusE/F